MEDLNKELEKVQEELNQARQETNQSLVVQEKPQPLATTINDGQDTSLMLKEKKAQVLKSQEAKDLSDRIAVEDVKADFANEAARINEKNVKAAEKELDNKTRQRRLDRLNAELDEQHKYNMAMIKQNGEHMQMLDKRKKMVEKYGYLYKQDDMVKVIDGERNEYLVPKDFSYSKIVNIIRQAGRNISKLDKPILQFIKWFAIIGIIVLGIFVLKWTGIIK